MTNLVLRQGAWLAAAGIAVGAAGSLALTRFLQGLVFGVSTTDPVAFLGVIVLLATVALAASWLPARRAARVDPMSVLRVVILARLNLSSYLICISRRARVGLPRAVCGNMIPLKQVGSLRARVASVVRTHWFH